MTTREAPAQPVTQEQIEELPNDISPYLQALVLAYLASGGEESDQTNRRVRAFSKALKLAALGAFLFRDRDKEVVGGIDFGGTAEPFTAAVSEAVTEYQTRHSAEERTPETNAKFAESVASTLSTGAANRLTLEVLNQLDPGGTAYKKLWLTRADDKVRMSHRELHGRTASIGDSFKPGLSYPGDPSAPLDERINCRCFLFAVPSGQDAETAQAFEPADFETAFAASAELHTIVAGNTMRRLLRLAPWTWQPRDSIGRWVEVGDVMHAPAMTGKGKERGRVVEIIGRNRVRLESLRFPDRTWDVDSRDTAPDFSKATLGNKPTAPHLQPIPNPRAERGRRAERLAPEFGELTPDIPQRPIEREIRPPLYGRDQQVAGAPIFEPHELAPEQVVVVESKSKPGTFRHMIVDEIGEDGNTVLLRFPPEPRRKVAESKGSEITRIFELENIPSRQEVFLDEGVLYEAADPNLVQEVQRRTELSQYGFANPYWFRDTQSTFKNGPTRADYVPERKALHDQFIQEEYDFTADAQDQPTLYIIGGGTASGKSTMLHNELVPIPPRGQAIHADADAAKYRLPEFIGLMEAGERTAASFVHEESSDMAYRMVKEAPPNKHIVFDGVSNNTRESVLRRTETGERNGMRVIGHYATVPTEMAVGFSQKRYEIEGPKGGRWVDPAFIRRSHAGVTDTFFDLAKFNDFDQLFLWNNEIENEPRLIYSQVDGQAIIHDDALLIEFLNKSRTRKHTYESIVALTDSGFTFPPRIRAWYPPAETPILPEVTGVEGEAPAGLAAAGEPMQPDNEYWDDLSWETMVQAAIEVAAEIRGAEFESVLPPDPRIEEFKQSLRDNAGDDPNKQLWIPDNS